MSESDNRTHPVALHLDGSLLRTIRLGMELSQAEFARLIRQAGQELECPNACNKRLVQCWEAGGRGCRPNYRRALMEVTGLAYAQLCAGASQAESGSRGTGAHTAGLNDLGAGDGSDSDRTALVLLGEVTQQLVGIQARLEEIARGLGV